MMKFVSSLILCSLVSASVFACSGSSGDDRFPAWSPDGKQIAFTNDRDGEIEVFVMDADGTNVRQLP